MLLLLLLLLLLVAGQGPWGVVGSVLSSSRLESCLNNGSGSIACQAKVVLTVTLEHGQGKEETAQFLIREVKDGQEASKSLQKPWRISWQKSAAHWRYPLRYVQDVNANPKERIIRTGWLGCSDNPLNVAEELTCGVAMLSSQRVQNSEGFCCGCSFGDITGGHPTRGSVDCGGLQMAETAHCLGFDPLWYSIFEVDRPQVFYDITVSIARPDDPAAGWSSATYHQIQVTLSHQRPVAEVEDGALRLELVGDLATAVAPHRFESRYLAVPSRPAGHPRVVRSRPLEHAMLVDRSLFELSGRTCNQIGVSYTAFKHQPQKCQVPAGSCLDLQLEDLYEEDTARVERGQRARYLISGFCEGALELGKQRPGSGGSTRFLACPMRQRHTTLLRLEARADEALFVTNVASGRIVSAAAQAFEALQGGTEAEIVIVNTGRIAAGFTLGVDNCSTAALAAAPAVRLSLRPFESSHQRIRLFMGRQTGGHWTCVATLYSAVGAVLDDCILQVNVSDLEQTSGVQVPADNPEGETASGVSRDGGECSSVCPSFFDLLCFLTHSCWDRLLVFVLVFGGLLCMACCCCWAAKNGYLCQLLECLCKCCCAPSSGSATPSMAIRVEAPRAPAPMPVVPPAVCYPQARGPSPPAAAPHGLHGPWPQAPHGLYGPWPQEGPTHI